MFDVSTTLARYQETLLEIEQVLVSPGSSPTTSEIQAIHAFRQTVDSVCDQVSSSYARSGNWANEGYLSAKTAIVLTTGIRPRSVNVALAQGNLLHQFPIVAEAVRSSSITNDHAACLVPLANETYVEYFTDDVNELVEVGKTVNAEQFSYVIRHWKNMIDAVIDEPSEEFVHFENRKLFLNELADGTWLVHGELDAVTGKILDKALKCLSEKVWRNSSSESRYDYTPAQQRADAIGYIAQGFVSSGIPAQSPAGEISSKTLFRYNPHSALTADIIVDLDDLNKETTTRDFLKKCLHSASPLINTHSHTFVEQILCDTDIHVPFKNADGTYNLGRTARTAPWKIKKQLMLSQTTCSIPGCTIPAQWCDAHHIHHWLHGGVTSVENLALVCRRHHMMMHNDKTFEEKHRAALKVKPPPEKTG
ncbi:MAG TPA: DUF222 domain-containing protein [Acidimicrobiia bacterium]|nr:DUF222 domain-containing protein [Acidimicrobiia bacterium]